MIVQNTSQQPVPPPKGWAWASEFARNNPLAVGWNAILFCGGVTLLSYHTSINYLPDFSLSDLAGLLASVTLVGLLLIVFIASACLLPAFILYTLDEETTVFGTTARSFSGKRDGALLFLFPLVGWSLLLGPLFFFDSFTEYYGAYPRLAIGLPLIVLVGGLAWARMRPLPAASFVGPPQPVPLWWKEFLRRLCGLFLWTFMFLMPLYMATMFASVGEQEREWFALGAGVFLFVAINFIAYSSPIRSWWIPLAIGSVFLVFILPTFTNRPMLWPQIIMQTLSLGNRNAEEIVVSYKQCQSLVKFGAHCAYGKNADSQISLRNVNVLSRIGTSILVEAMVEAVNPPLPVPPAGNTAPTNLFTTEFARFCPGSLKKGVRSRCSRCDGLSVEKSDSMVPKNFKENLVCVQMAIPKDQVTSISWSDRRQYNGFTSYSLPAGD